MNVDLPEPFGPVSPYRRPSENVVVTSSKSTFDPNRIDTPCTAIIEEPADTSRAPRTVLKATIEATIIPRSRLGRTQAGIMAARPLSSCPNRCRDPGGILDIARRSSGR